MSYRWSGWSPYVPVAQRRANAAKALQKVMKKTGKVPQPVEISGRAIALSFWGKGWCDHMESFHDYANRLPRGRTYVRNGSVCHLEIKEGKIEAMVSGSTMYNVVIAVAPLLQARWSAVKSSCIGGVASLIDLLRGKLSSGVMEVVSHRTTGLFPLPGEIKFGCDCPDSAVMCKHVAAVLYGVGARLDHAPEKLFELRGVNHEELVDLPAAGRTVAAAGGSRRRMAAAGLGDMFGIDLAEAVDVVSPSPPEEVKASAGKASAGKASAGKASAGKAVAGKAVAGNVSAAPLPAPITEAAPPASPLSPTPFPKRLTGSVILKWRERLGETQLQFASRIGVSGSCISQWEKKLRQALQVRDSAREALQKAWTETQQ